MRVLGVLSPIVSCVTLESFLNLCELSFSHGHMGAVVSALEDYSQDGRKSCVESAQPLVSFTAVAPLCHLLLLLLPPTRPQLAALHTLSEEVFTRNLWGRYSLPHITDKETETEIST